MQNFDRTSKFEREREMKNTSKSGRTDAGSCNLLQKFPANCCAESANFRQIELAQDSKGEKKKRRRDNLNCDGDD